MTTMLDRLTRQAVDVLGLEITSFYNTDRNDANTRLVIERQQ